MPTLRRFAILALLVPVVALTACGDDDDDDSGSASSTPAATSEGGGGTTVSLTEFKIAPDPVEVKAGKVSIEGKNDGNTVHELVLIKTDKDAGDLESGGEVAEDGEVAEVEDIASGESKTLEATVEPGHYALICNLPGHYTQGMHANMTVS